jgi:hypothetical protein
LRRDQILHRLLDGLVDVRSHGDRVSRGSSLPQRSVVQSATQVFASQMCAGTASGIEQAADEDGTDETGSASDQDSPRVDDGPRIAVSTAR